MGEAWGFIWLMVLLKIPIAALLYLVWWSIHATPDPEAVDEGDGGIGGPKPPAPRPAPPAPRRRGPHGEPAPPPPERTRKPRPAPGRAPR